MVTIKDVAAMANVSTATVSRAINSPELVSDERREAVQRAIAALNYHPNDIARSLQKSESYVVGVLVPDITNIFTTDVISAIGAELQQHGYAMFLAISNHDPQTEQALVNLMMEKRVAGIIMLGSRRPNEESDRLINNAALSVPIVAIDYTNNCNLYCVRMDETLGIFKAVNYLYKLGHRRIAFINGTTSIVTHYYKNIGYVNAMTQLGLEQYIQPLTVEVSPDYAGGAKGVDMLLRGSVVPTAIVTGGDKMAIGAYYGLFDNGLRLPIDMSLVGFSGSTISGYTTPPMTTIDQKSAYLGTLAANIVIDVCSGNTNVDRNVIIEPELLIRGSCRRIG